MNTLKEKIEILKAMDKGLTIQYSETDGETDDWEDLLTGELDFGIYEYRVKPNSEPKGNPKDKIELLEFTGHYDTKGKEIYSGYIVSFMVNDKTYTGVIEWSNEYASFLVKTKDYYEEYLNEIDEMLVLGNIYENKELINEITKI